MNGHSPIDGVSSSLSRASMECGGSPLPVGVRRTGRAERRRCAPYGCPAKRSRRSSDSLCLRTPQSGGSWATFFVLLVLVILGGQVRAVERTVSEVKDLSELKAHMIVNVLVFTHWPTNTFSGADSPFLVGILGKNDPVGPILERTLRQVQHQGHSVRVKWVETVDQMKKCQLLFISAAEVSGVSENLKALGDASVLTISDADGFTRRGGVVALALNRTRHQVELSKSAGARAGLYFRPGLLNFSNILP